MKYWENFINEKKMFCTLCVPNAASVIDLFLYLFIKMQSRPNHVDRITIMFATKSGGACREYLGIRHSKISKLQCRVRMWIACRLLKFSEQMCNSGALHFLWILVLCAFICSRIKHDCSWWCVYKKREREGFMFSRGMVRYGGRGCLRKPMLRYPFPLRDQLYGIV